MPSSLNHFKKRYDWADMDILPSGHGIIVDSLFDPCARQKATMTCPQSTSRKALYIFVETRIDPSRTAIVDIGVSLMVTRAKSAFQKTITGAYLIACVSSWIVD